MTQLILLTDQMPSSIVFYMSSIGGLMTIWFVILIILLSIVLVVQAIHQRIDEMEKSPWETWKVKKIIKVFILFVFESNLIKVMSWMMQSFLKSVFDIIN